MVTPRGKTSNWAEEVGRGQSRGRHARAPDGFPCKTGVDLRINRQMSPRCPKHYAELIYLRRAIKQSDNR